MKNIFFLFSLILCIYFLRVEVKAAARCEVIFNKSETPQTETWQNFYKNSDLRPRPSLWLRIRQSLEKHVTHLQSPLEMAGADPNRLGSVYKSMKSELPLLRQLIEADQLSQLSHAHFIKLKRLAVNQIISVSQRPNSALQVFSCIEALKFISSIESRVEFPRSDEEKKNQEVKEQESTEDQITDQKKDQKKDQKDESEDDQKQKWNKTEEKYKPENKELNNDKGKKNINVDIAMTNADVPKKLLRQKVYDLFDYKNWTTNPVQRNQVSRENKFTKKLIIDSLGEAEIDVPVPYGYTLIAGKYQDYQIKEIGPGEFKLYSMSKDKIALGLSRVLDEPLQASLQRPTHAEINSNWPKHLLTYTESLKGLSPIEAASKLEKYISEEGGFLYFSQGDKLDKAALSKMDQKMKSLILQMPKPMAMANVGAFNCDGAAWIGALLLRDILGLQVRIASGRTSAGTHPKGHQYEGFHVVRSSDPAHAWLEVHDGVSWKPFDMTPKNNKADSESAPNDLEREEQKPTQSKEGQLDPKNSDSKPNNEKQEQEVQKNLSEESNDSEKKDSYREDDKGAESQDGKDRKKIDQSEHQEVSKEIEDTQQTNIEVETKKIEELLKAKTTQRQNNESHQTLIDKLLKHNELIFLEQLIYEGYETNYNSESSQILAGLKEHSIWKIPVERSEQIIAGILNQAAFSKFKGLRQLLNDVRVDFGQNKARDAKQKLMIAERFLLALSEYRQLTRSEVDALSSIQKMTSLLQQVKHTYSQQFDVVQDLLRQLPGNISKDWLRNQYGKDFDQLGTASNLKMAEDIVSGKLKPLLQMGAVSDFVDMTLNSTQEPHWKDNPTLNRSILPKPRQDLIITRNPLDFAKMLWNLRPGENMFAPTLQGRQFAMGSLETRRVPNPKYPIEKKVSVVYYDISASMSGHPLETVDALLMAFADHALSEMDAIGRPTHEIYLIPFDDKIYEGVHISSREDAQNFLAKKMRLKTQPAGGTDIQKVIENFYNLISSSYKLKSGQGRDKLFQKANMVLFSDGESQIDINRIEEARKQIPESVQINMNFVSIGDQVNQILKKLALNENLASTKPTFKQINSQMISSVAQVTVEYDPQAFATNEKMPAQILTEVNALLPKVNIDPRQKSNTVQLDGVVTQLQITKSDISSLSGLSEVLNLQKLVDALVDIGMSSTAKQSLVQAVVESYQQLTGRNLKNMIYDEKESIEKMIQWARR